MGISEYMLKVNLFIMVSWLLYWVAFRQFTFFQWNRVYLTGSVLLSFMLPLLRLPRGSHLAVADLGGLDWEYVNHVVQLPSSVKMEGTIISVPALLLVLYFTGVILMMVLYVRRYLNVRKLMSASCREMIKGTRVYVHDGTGGSFTFLRKVYLNRHTWENKVQHVIRHEMAHASQLHSLDLIFMALPGILLWFNPFVLLLLRSVRENHEYLADDEALCESDALPGYLACLREETIRRYSPAVASYFKSSTIKKRIIMLTRQNTNSQKKWRYTAFLPLTAFMLLAFQVYEEPDVFTAEENFPAVSNRISSEEIPSLFPLPPQYLERITWNFNEKAINPITKKLTVHSGIDIAAPRGTAVYAAADGIVKKAELMDGWGNLVVIEHSGGYSTFYAHLDEFLVSPGGKVERGQKVASVGSTGNSTGPHLHYEVRKAGMQLNPADYY